MKPLLIALFSLAASCTTQSLWCDVTSQCPSGFYCSPETTVCTPIEPGVDTGTDSGSDSGTDTGSDSATGSDAGSDSGSDSGSGTDSGLDSGSDSGPFPMDSGLSDSGPPPGPDPGCQVGVPTPECPECFDQVAAVCTCGSNPWCCVTPPLPGWFWDTTCAGTYSTCRHSNGGLYCWEE